MYANPQLWVCKTPLTTSLIPQYILINTFELAKASSKIEKHRRHQAHRPPSKDRKSRSARRHRRRISHVVYAHVSELAFLVQKSAVGSDVADV